MEACTNLHCWVLCQQQLNVTLIDPFLGQYGSYCIVCRSSIRCVVTFVDHLLHLSVSIIDLDRLSRSSNNACRVLRSWYNGFRSKIDTPLCLRKSGIFVVFSKSVSTPTIKRTCCLKLCLHLNKQFLTPEPPPPHDMHLAFLSISITTHIWN